MTATPPSEAPAAPAAPAATETKAGEKKKAAEPEGKAQENTGDKSGEKKAPATKSEAKPEGKPAEAPAADGEKPAAPAKKKRVVVGPEGTAEKPAVEKKPESAPAAPAAHSRPVVATLPFTKVEGLGNDFVVVDLRDARRGDDARRRSRSRRWCARCAIASSASAPTACSRSCPATAGDARMRVLNADGSEAEMCGNGIRCVAKELYDRARRCASPSCAIDTGAGLLRVRDRRRGGARAAVAVEMGARG